LGKGGADTAKGGAGGTTKIGGSGGSEPSGGTAGSGAAASGGTATAGSTGSALGGSAGSGGSPPITCEALTITCGDGVSFTSTKFVGGYDAYQCNATGDGYRLRGDCTETEYCYAGNCHPQVCTPSARYCLDQYQAATCTALGTGATLVQNCLAAGAYCSEGLCVEAAFFEDFEPVGGRTWEVYAGTTRMFNEWSWYSDSIRSDDDGKPSGDEIWMHGGSVSHALGPLQPAVVAIDQYCTDGCTISLLNENSAAVVQLGWTKSTGELRIYGPSDSMIRAMTSVTSLAWLHFEITDMDFTEYTYSLRVSHYGPGGNLVSNRTGLFFINPAESITGIAFGNSGTAPAIYMSGWDNVIVF
jgi:hypothetical protein